MKLGQVGVDSNIDQNHSSNPSGVICDEGVLAVDLCTTGPLCKLDCPWLNPYFFLTFGGWFVAGREQPFVADVHTYCWEPGGTHSMVGFSQECTPVRCRDFAPKVDPVRQISVLFLFVHSMSTFYIMFTPTYTIIPCSLIFSVPCLFL